MNASIVAEWISSVASWSASVSLEVVIPAIVVLVVSRLRLIPARWCAVLAVIVLARLILPFSVPVSWRAPLPSLSSSAVDEASPVAFDPIVIETVAAPSTWSSLFPWLWALGVVSVLCWLLVSHFSIRRMVMAGKPAESRLSKLLGECADQEGVSPVPELFVVTGLATMAVFGWLRPRLLVPAGLTEKHTEAELRGIFLHEIQHLKRQDALWTWLGLIACAVHWFNPLAWMLFRRFTADRELACDEAVLGELRAEDRRIYGEALIKTAEHICAAPPALLPSFSTHPTELKYRMTLIMKPQNRSVALQFASVAFGLGITTFAFTTARADGEKPRAAEEGKGREESAEGRRERGGASDVDGEKKGPRDGEGEKSGTRDGEGKKTGPRDGDGKEKGERDGDQPKRGNREGDGERGKREGMKEGEREGARKSAEGEGKGSREGGETMSKTAPPSGRASGQQLVIQVDAAGNVVNSRGDIIPIGQVRSRMASYAAANPDQPVSLRGDPATPYDKVLKVVDALRDVGLKNVQLESAQK